MRAILVFLVFFPASTHAAEWLRWKDADGVLHLTDKMENVPLRYRSSVLRLDVPPTPERPISEEILETPETASVPLMALGETAVVQVLLNDHTEVGLIVDTGATYTVISHEIAHRLSIDLTEGLATTELQTANGVITAPVVELESVQVGGIKMNNIAAAVHDFSQERSVAGLLGLNFLRHFRIDIDAGQKTLTLERRDR